MTYRILSVFIFIYEIFLHDASAQTINLSIVNINVTNPKHIEIIKDSLESFYNCKVTDYYSIESNPGLISKAYKKDQKYNFTVLNALTVNNHLNEFNKDNNEFVIGITDSALTIGEKFLSPNYLIRGLANDSLKIATISTYKIKNESESKIDFVSNLAKVVKHEFGHLLGMPHCSSESCLMVNGYRFDMMTENYCKDCINKIDTRLLIME